MRIPLAATAKSLFNTTRRRSRPRFLATFLQCTPFWNEVPVLLLNHSFVSDYGHDHMIFWDCHCLAKRIRWLARLQFQEKRTSSFWLLWPVLCFWTMDTLDPCSEDDINNDVSSLYVEIIDKNRSYYKCTICGRKLSRKQRLKTHSEQAWLLCWSICWSVSVKHDPSNDPGSKKWRFDAKGKPWRSTLWQRKKLNRKLESYNNEDEKRRSDVFNLSC